MCEWVALWDDERRSHLWVCDSSDVDWDLCVTLSTLCDVESCVWRMYVTSTMPCVTLTESCVWRYPQRPPTPEQAADGQDDPVYDPAVWDEVPEEFHDYTLEKLVHNRLELEHFKQFLAEKVRFSRPPHLIVLVSVCVTFLHDLTFVSVCLSACVSVCLSCCVPSVGGVSVV